MGSCVWHAWGKGGFGIRRQENLYLMFDLHGEKVALEKMQEQCDHRFDMHGEKEARKKLQEH